MVTLCLKPFTLNHSCSTHYLCRRWGSTGKGRAKAFHFLFPRALITLIKIKERFYHLLILIYLSLNPLIELFNIACRSEAEIPSHGVEAKRRSRHLGPVKLSLIVFNRGQQSPQSHKFIQKLSLFTLSSHAHLSSFQIKNLKAAPSSLSDFPSPSPSKSFLQKPLRVPDPLTFNLQEHLLRFTTYRTLEQAY